MITRPKTKLGQLSLVFIGIFFGFLAVFFGFVNAGERGGDTYFSNLWLAVPFTTAWMSAIVSFAFGLISILWKKERSWLVFGSALIGLLVLVFILGEILSPH